MGEMALDGDITASSTTLQPRITGRGGGGELTPIRTRERGQELARKRWEGVSRAARLGLGDAGEQLPDVNARQPLKVVRFLTEQHALNAADPSAKGAVASFRQVMELAYPKPEREQGAEGGAGGSVSITFSGEAAMARLAQLVAGAMGKRDE